MFKSLFSDICSNTDVWLKKKNYVDYSAAFQNHWETEIKKNNYKTTEIQFLSRNADKTWPHGCCGLWLNAVLKSFCTRFQSQSHKQLQIGSSSCVLCHLLEWVGGGAVVYSLKRLSFGVFPHGERQRRSEEEHLALIPFILRKKIIEILNPLREIIWVNILLKTANLTASSPRAVFMLSLTLYPSLPSKKTQSAKEREKERVC